MTLENTSKYSVQRRYKRSSIAAQVGFFHDDKYYFGNTITISEGGMLFRCTVPLEAGSSIEAHFCVNGEFLKVKASVLYQNHLGKNPNQNSFLVGVKFSDLPLQGQIAVRNYVRDH